MTVWYVVKRDVDSTKLPVTRTCVSEAVMTMVWCRVDEWNKNVDEMGQPYHWVQWLCGLEFLADDPSRVSVSLSRSHMCDTVQRLRARIYDRLSLQKQLATFGLYLMLTWSNSLFIWIKYIVFPLNEQQRLYSGQFPGQHKSASARMLLTNRRGPSRDDGGQ